MINKRSFCIHGHFYQPPREDPFTGTIPDEPGAAPYKNFNDHALETCYRPNAELRNFSRISFNLGPTLVRWMHDAAPEVLESIVKEDEVNQAIYGAGNAIAQSYNHSILPLANSRDKRTQVKWGISAFEYLFHRKPEGMWLPETAVDAETLAILVDNHIQFTIVAPWQVEVLEGRAPYQVELNDGRSIVAFVYHGGLSSTVSFDTFATGNADAFAEYYLKPEIDNYDPDQFLMIATDGELYGHHQPFRDKFLSQLLNGSVKGTGLQQTWPGLWLKQHAVKGKARIVENTSWSCHHGVERWRSACGCTPDSNWKAPLRRAFDQLNEAIYQDYQNECCGLGIDPLQTRDEYILVILQVRKSEEWVRSVVSRALTDVEITRVRKLFEAQYACQQMFTSCGWFFDDLARIEPRMNISHAAHAATLMNQVNGINYTEAVQAVLAEAVDEKNHTTAADYFMTAYRRFSRQ